MKTKFAKLALIAVLGTAGATAAFAHDAASAAAKQMIDLKDGSTLYVFKDGKMAVEDKYGHAMRMKRHLLNELAAGLPYDILSVRLDTACAILAEITGEITSEEVLRAVFDGFCIGK